MGMENWFGKFRREKEETVRMELKEDRLDALLIWNGAFVQDIMRCLV